MNHRRVRAVAECSDCGDPLCKECVAWQARGKTLCTVCAFRARQYGDVDVPPELREKYPEYATLPPPEKGPPPPESPASGASARAAAEAAVAAAEVARAARAVQDAAPESRPEPKPEPTPEPKPEPTPEPTPEPNRPAAKPAPRKFVPVPATREPFHFRLPGLMLPLAAILVVTAGYMVFQLFIPQYQEAETTAVPAQEVPGYGNFKECRHNLMLALIAVESGSGRMPVCPSLDTPYKVSRQDGRIVIECPNPDFHGVKRLYIDSGRRLALVER